MNLIRALGVGAVSLLAIGGWHYLGAMQKKAQLPSKQETLAVLENIRKEFYPVLLRIADYVSKELAPRGIPPGENEQLVLANASIKAQIEAVNQRVYAQLRQEDVREATEKLYQEDADILRQKHEFREEYKKALLGIKPEPQMVASRRLTKSKVLEAVNAILNDKIARLEAIRVAEAEGDDKRLLLEGDVEEDERATKEHIRNKLGLSVNDSIAIFQFAVGRYLQEDPSFKREYDAIVAQYTQNVRKLVPNQ